MNFTDLQNTSYALSIISEDMNNPTYLPIVEYNGKLLVANFLKNDFDFFPKELKYNSRFQEETVRFTDFEEGTDYQVIDLRKKYFQTFLDSFTKRSSVPNDEHLINAIISLVNDTDKSLKPLNTFNIAYNVKFLESGLTFDSYRFPDDAAFNLVALQKD